jgi:osmotically-inducible protein OsmY
MRSLIWIGLLVLPPLLLSGCAAVVVGGAATVGAVHDRRSFGTVLDDNNIELTGYDLLNQDRELTTQSRVTLIVYNGVALLIGEAPSATPL